MDQKKFNKIIQFAINKEIRSYTFYINASKMEKFSGSKALFLDLAKKEEGHRKMLEKLDMEKITKARIVKVPDLKISDYMAKIEFKPNLSYANILRVAMKMEESSLKLYKDLKEKNTNKDLKKLFGLLANEEAKHKLRLEKIYDQEILK